MLPDWAHGLLPWLLVIAGLLWAVIELRVRKIIEAKVETATEKVKFELRTEFQKPIGEIGVDAIEAHNLARSHVPRIVELEAKTNLFWKMVENSTAGLLRQKEED